MRERKGRVDGEGKHITAFLQIIFSNSCLFLYLMSLEIGEITFFDVALISAGVANLLGFVSSLWDCAACYNGAWFCIERSNKLTSRPVNRWGSSLWSGQAWAQAASWFTEALQWLKVFRFNHGARVKIQFLLKLQSANEVKWQHLFSQ